MYELIITKDSSDGTYQEMSVAATTETVYELQIKAQGDFPRGKSYRWVDASENRIDQIVYGPSDRILLLLVDDEYTGSAIIQSESPRPQAVEVG